MAILDEQFDATKITPYDSTEILRERALESYSDYISKARAAVNGSRNNALNAAAFAIGRMVGAGLVERQQARKDLVETAKQLMMSVWEYDRLIERSLDNGAMSPWTLDVKIEPTTTLKPKLEFKSEPNPVLEQEKAIKSHNAATMYNEAGEFEKRGIDHLKKRKITKIPDVVRYSGAFHGIVYPLITPDGSVIAIQKVFLNQDGSNTMERHKNDDGTFTYRKKKTTHGDMRNSMLVIHGKPGPIILVDGPEDALSAHQATGLTAMAACSKSRFAWAADHLKRGDVLFAVRDADGTDNSEYGKAVKAFAAVGIDVIWIDPPAPHKDVNDILKAGGDEAVEQWFTDAWHRARGTAPESACEPEAVAAPEVAELDEPTPGGLPEPSGLVREIRDYIVRTSIYPHPMLALGAALTIIGTVAGRRYSYDQNIRTNLYVLGLAPSGSGKGSVLAGVQAILGDAGFDSLMGGSVPASGSAVVSRVIDSPVTTYVIDEFGMMLRAMADPQAAGHIKDITKVWTELYTASAGRYADKDRADRKSNAPRLVHQPSLSVFGITNAVHVWQSITPDSMLDGSLARYIVLETDENYPMPEFNREIAKTPDRIIQALQKVAEHGIAVGGGNLHEGGGPCMPSVRPIIASPEVEAIWRQLMVAEVDLKRKHDKDGLAPIYGRMVEQAKKLALIHAIGRDTVFTQIERIDADWAIGTVRELTDRLAKNLVKHVAKNQQERGAKDLLAIIRKERKWMAKSDLTRKTQWLKARERDELIQDLMDSGQLENRLTNSRYEYRAVITKRKPADQA